MTIEQYNHRRGVTLLELLITIAIFSTLVLAVTSIDLFSHYHVISSDRRVKLQNEISYTLEHMTKEISRASGNRVIAGKNPIDTTPISGDNATKIHIDSDGDGQADLWIAYCFHNASTNPQDYQIRYCPNCTDGAACLSCNPNWGIDPNNIIGRRIKEFIPVDNSTSNYMDIGITARWQPVEENATVDNPGVTLRTRIKMPSVTTN